MTPDADKLLDRLIVKTASGLIHWRSTTQGYELKLNNVTLLLAMKPATVSVGGNCPRLPMLMLSVQGGNHETSREWPREFQSKVDQLFALVEKRVKQAGSAATAALEALGE